MPSATSSYYSVVRNTSGKTMYFDWIGEHGTELANGADAKVPGNVLDLWQKCRLKRASMAYALENNLAEIIKTPDVFAFDAGWGAVRRLKFNAGDVTAQDPDYGSYGGSAPTLTGSV